MSAELSVDTGGSFNSLEGFIKNPESEESKTLNFGSTNQVMEKFAVHSKLEAQKKLYEYK